MATPRPGSMASADAKATKRFKIVAAVIYIGILLAIFAFNTFLHDAARTASTAVNVIGAMLILISYYLLYSASDLANMGRIAAIGVTLVLGIGFAVGWNL